MMSSGGNPLSTMLPQQSMGARPTDLMASVQNQNFLKAQNSINGLPGASTGLGAIAGAIGHSPQMIDAQSMSDMSNDFLF